MAKTKNCDKPRRLTDYPDMLTVVHLCELLHTGKKTIYGMMNRGELKYAKVGRSHVSSKKWLKEYLDGKQCRDLNNYTGHGKIVATLKCEPARKEIVA